MSKSFETDLNKSKLNEDCCCHAAVHLDFKLDRNLKALLLHHLEWNLVFSARKASLSGFSCMLYPSGLACFDLFLPKLQMVERLWRHWSQAQLLLSILWIWEDYLASWNLIFPLLQLWNGANNSYIFWSLCVFSKDL